MHDYYSTSSRDAHIWSGRPCYPLSVLNIQSSFTVQNPRMQLVKIEHVILLYLTSANLDSALLTITHKNRALLTMADFFCERFQLMNNFVKDFKPHLNLIM